MDVDGLAHQTFKLNTIRVFSRAVTGQPALSSDLRILCGQFDQDLPRLVHIGIITDSDGYDAKRPRVGSGKIQESHIFSS